jgi:hypothetical protein
VNPIEGAWARGYSGPVRLVQGVLVAFAVGLCVTACGSDTEEAAPPATAPPQPAETQTTAPSQPAEAQPAPKREAAPAVAGETLSGEAIALGDFRGRPVLVNVWSSW